MGFAVSLGQGRALDAYLRASRAHNMDLTVASMYDTWKEPYIGGCQN